MIECLDEVQCSLGKDDGVWEEDDVVREIALHRPQNKKYKLVDQARSGDLPSE
jgi:hypothetical protein